MRGLSGVSKGGTAIGARGGAGRSASGFSVGGSGAAPSGAPTAEGSGAAAPAAVAGPSLLAAQENGGGRGGEGRNAAARRRAASILDELRGLQAELLCGRPDAARLARLASLGAGEEGTDSGLREAVRAVALRARIELARRGMRPDADRTATVR